MRDEIRRHPEIGVHLLKALHVADGGDRRCAAITTNAWTGRAIPMA